MVRSAFRATAIFNNLVLTYFVRGGCSRKAVTTVTRIMEPRCNVPPGLFFKRVVRYRGRPPPVPPLRLRFALFPQRA